MTTDERVSDAVGGRLELSRLRRSLEERLREFSALENFMVSRDLAGEIKQFDVGPGQSDVAWCRYWSYLAQELPFRPVGLSRIELCIQHLPDVEDAHLSLRLQSQGIILAEWLCSLDDLQEGWNSFSLHEPLPDIPGPATLVAELRSRQEAGAKFWLGRQTVPERLRAWTAGGAEGGCLAMRLFTAAPGYTPTVPPGSAPADEGVLPGRLFAVGPWSELNLVVPEESRTLVAPIGDLWLRAHPRWEIPTTVAALIGAVDGASELTVECRIDHADAGPSRFSAAIVPLEDASPEALDVAFERDGARASLVLDAGEAGQLRLRCDGADGPGPYALILRTEVLETDHFAWCEWGAIRLRMNSRRLRHPPVAPRTALVSIADRVRR